MSRLLCWLLVVLLFSACGKRNILSPKTDQEGIKMYQIKSKTTDPGIVQDRFPNQVYLAPDVNPRNQLLLFLGATNSVPEDYQLFLEQAASLGYHVINMNYSNSPSVQICAGDANPECFERMREEVQTGRNTSNRIFVNEVHSVDNRLRKLLEYLHQLSPTENWNQYYRDTAIRYGQMVIAGHAQGAGQAAYIGKEFEVARVILFSGPNDYSAFFGEAASWATGFFETDLDRYFAFSHRDDEIHAFALQYAFWDQLGLTALGDTTEVGEGTINGTPHLLYTRMEPRGGVISLGKYHNSVVVDRFTPRTKGEPDFVAVWDYLLR